MKTLLTFLVFIQTVAVFGQQTQKHNPSDFLPKDYKIYEKISGDLNKDGVEDCILVIKGTDTNNIDTDEYRGRLDRNRRGIIILFKKKDNYELITKNYNCFSSENEDGGMHYPPELSIGIASGNIIVSYQHGRYGEWKYTFRLNNHDFELIGYDHGEYSGAILNRETSINFLTKKKKVVDNTNENLEQQAGEEILKTTWMNIKYDKPVKLSTIKDFDNLNMSTY